MFSYENSYCLCISGIVSETATEIWVWGVETFSFIMEFLN